MVYFIDMMRYWACLFVGFLSVIAAAPHALAQSGGVQFTATPDKLVMDANAGTPATVALEVKVGPGQGPVTLKGIIPVQGKVSPPKAAGKGVWRATLTVPTLSFPSVAVLRAELQVGKQQVRRWLAIPVSVKTAMPIQAPPGGDVMVTIGAKDHGPVKVPKNGLCMVPVVIHPGAGTAVVATTDKKGVTKNKTHRFNLPPIPRISVVTPTKATAGSTIVVEAFVVDKWGQRLRGEEPLVVNIRGAMPLKIKGTGAVQKHWLRLSGEIGSLVIEVVSKYDRKARITRPLTVEVARKLIVKVRANPDKLQIGGASSARVTILVTDQFGHAVDPKGTRLTGNGKAIAISRIGKGHYQGWLWAPKTPQPGHRIVLRAGVAGIPPTKAVVKVLGTDTAKVALKLLKHSLRADGKQGIRFEIRAWDRFGMPPNDRSVKVTSPHGKLAFLHWVRAGFYRGHFVPHRKPTGGTAVITVSAPRTESVSARLKLKPLPQRSQLTPLVGVFSDVSRMLGVAVGLRYEYAVYRKYPSVHIGGEAHLWPSFAVSGVADDGSGEVLGVAAGASFTTRLRVVQTGRFRLDVSIGVGVLGLFVQSKVLRGPGDVDTLQSSYAAFTAAAGAEIGVLTTGQDEFFLLVQARYLSASVETGTGANRAAFLGALGYRFKL